MKISTKISLVIIQVLLFTVAQAQRNFWSDAGPNSLQNITFKRLTIPEKGRTVTLAYDEIKQFLRQVPQEFTPAAATGRSLLALPMPDGSFQNFAISETALMEPGLAAQFPDIKTYAGQGIEDPTATVRIDITPAGFHAMVLAANGGSVFIDPYFRTATDNYISYYKKDFKSDKKLVESERYFKQERKAALQAREQAGPCIGGTLKTYRLAVACTGEYAVAVGATTKAQALAAITTTINRVVGVYEKELDIRMVLVANEQKVIFIDAATDRFQGNDDADILIDESQKVITDSIGSANYDIGHTFSTGGGGLAGLGVVCISSQKANGITGSSNPTGDPYDIDYVAHEMGHQFGASHTFNSNIGSCATNGETSSNVEPGSGSTIMAYAGICGNNNLQANSDPQFHAISLQQINTYISGTGCAVSTATGNSAPSVNAGSDYIIPRSTPFIVNGSATDPNNDALTYSWEEFDTGGPFGNPTSPTGNAPLFRSFAPTTATYRIFPKLSNIINNTTTIGEVLPSYARNINLRLTARDNKAGGGGICSDDMLIMVSGVAGPFTVTAPNTATTWEVGSFKTITWNVNGTDQAPVSCANVSISLSTDGGLTFPILLAASTPNDGSEEIKVPANLTTQARIRVMAVGNIFFDMSNANFTIQNAATTEFIFNNPPTTTKCDGVNASVLLKTSGVNGFSNAITLTATAIPSGVTATFSANPVTPGQDVTVTLQGTLSPGNYTITISGEANGSSNKSQNLAFVVGPLTTASTLNQPANNSTGQSAKPTFTWSAVTGATSYTLEISTSSNFATLTQNISGITSTSYTIQTALADGTQYYWRVKPNNICGTGAASSAFLFKTLSIVCASPVYSTNVPKTISETGTPTVTSTLNIASGSVISDINVVGLKGTHDYISDITVSLTSPANTTITLFDRICNKNKNFDLNLDDEATLSSFPCPPIGGVTVKPTEALSIFNGQSSTGTWSLKIKDNFDGDGGSLTAWGLRVCSSTNTPLPVNWLSFTAQKSAGNTVNLQWSTANEVKNHYYIIERSTDGVNFGSIGKMDGGKNLSMTQQYYFNDLKPFVGTSYYRLKQVDVDGQFTYSSIARVSIERSAWLWTVFPNPAHGQSTIRMLSNATKVNVALADVSGKVVYRTSMASVRAGEQIEVPLQGLAQGIYLLKIETGSVIRTEKLIVR